MSPAVVILGGSTPFTAALVEALRASVAALPGCELRLFGTDAVGLERMRRYADARLRSCGWTTSCCRRLDEALDGVAVVVNQIRFGGLQGRARDEAMAASWHVPADETLGPGGLAAALRVAEPIRQLGAELARRCPSAWVLNLSNPLSVTTALLARTGPPRKLLGLCELPVSTATELCRLLRCSVDEVEWDYAGLNHRGLVFDFRRRGEDLLPCIPDLLGDETVFGITADEIREIGAVPLKYFELTRKRGAPTRRADFLLSLKDELAREIDAGETPPKALGKRRFDWYSGAVVPALTAIFSDSPRRLIVDVPGQDGMVRETDAHVSAAGMHPRAIDVPIQVREWLRPWEEHERAVLDAVAAPTLESVERALRLDPIVPEGRAAPIARDIWENHER